FLKYSSLIAGGTMIFPAGAIQARRSQTPGAPTYWYQEPLRILQTVLRESDAINYDAKAVVDYMKEAGCNMLVVNAGGIVDFFQNPLPAANINPFMGDRDILREITTLCKEAGFRVIVRVDFRGVEEHVYKQHPEWFSVDYTDAPKLLDYTEPALHSACYTGYYRTEHAQRFIRYLMEEYDIDGIWHNSIGVVGICHCDRCKASYREEFGADLPVENQSSAEEISQYMAWKESAADRHMELMKNTVKAYGEDKVYTAEVFTMFYGTQPVDLGVDLYNARDHFDFLVSVAFLTPNQEFITYDEITYAGTIVRFLKSMAPDKEAIILYGGNGTAHRYVMDAPVDLKVWLWQALAAGGRFWNCNFTGMHPDATHDRRNAFNGIEPYFFVKENEHLLEGQVPVQPVGLYYSKYTRLFYRHPPEEGDRFDACIQGMESVLIEHHIPHGFIADDQLTPELLGTYKLLVLPNVRSMSDKEIEIIREYVYNGGNLLATYATSLFDEDSRPREDFGLADVFGCHYTGEK
ncbi:beta-galactosidase trimerization domain-containing protein, partial [Balneolaceae bacterium ANBcel3]|nr:beta-galactosidase trimerization domain-containing protein [Balneolaceae bacterium ANBcel3]